MKTCDYCAKQIDYHHQYCCDECEKEAQLYYTRQKRSERPVSIVNVIAFFGAIIGGFCAAIFDPQKGTAFCAVMLTLLGITYLIFPYAPDGIVKKHKILKSIKLIRSIAIGFLAMAAVLFVLAIFVF
ncbi:MULTISPECIES: MFS transporter [unclassified Ruminococcus]|uniref:MFS transporter n=1 Tax=unclassified Ruminococcus TaxID=2608920 RepID=UPI00210A39DC|nr:MULTISPECIES: MFS transporter [unclassified Ruminococcus]MCQ4023170.1 MFS transporter [Ruminococcus sp. zg-924]MCQ4115388.1 MFS transporter [Ruminococcus sp. zg-921]